MRSGNHSVAGVRRKLYLSAALLFVLSMALSAALPRVHLVPKLAEGESLRYRIETETTTKGRTSTPIVNPEAATRVKQTANLVVRLNVLDVSRPMQDAAASQSVMQKTRVEITYEKSSATSESDAYDPQAAALDDQYDRLEGRSMEFTIQPGGKLSNIGGLEGLFSKPSAEQAVRSWMSGITFGARFPAHGIVPGQKWTAEEPLAGSPLRGLAWRRESTYLRNEPCETSAMSRRSQNPPPATSQNAAAAGACAVILTRFEIVRHGPKRGDATPDDYLRSGLRTSGTWTGHGESLNSISIQSGLLVVSTETVSQDMDYEIKSAASGSAMRYKGHSDSQSQISLISASEPSFRLP